MAAQRNNEVLASVAGIPRDKLYALLRELKFPELCLDAVCRQVDRQVRVLRVRLERPEPVIEPQIRRRGERWNRTSVVCEFIANLALVWEEAKDECPTRGKEKGSFRHFADEIGRIAGLPTVTPTTVYCLRKLDYPKPKRKKPCCVQLKVID